MTPILLFITTVAGMISESGSTDALRLIKIIVACLIGFCLIRQPSAGPIVCFIRIKAGSLRHTKDSDSDFAPDLSAGEILGEPASYEDSGVNKNQLY